jgi:hypothetical protein
MTTSSISIPNYMTVNTSTCHYVSTSYAEGLPTEFYKYREDLFWRASAQIQSMIWIQSKETFRHRLPTNMVTTAVN